MEIKNTKLELSPKTLTAIIFTKLQYQSLSEPHISTSVEFDSKTLARTNVPHLDFNLVEGLAVVHANHGPDHLGQNDHVPQVSLHHLWLLHWGSLLLGLTQALEERLLLAAQATVQPPPLAGAVQLHQLLAVHSTW